MQINSPQLGADVTPAERQLANSAYEGLKELLNQHPERIANAAILLGGTGELPESRNPTSVQLGGD